MNQTLISGFILCLAHASLYATKVHVRSRSYTQSLPTVYEHQSSSAAIANKQKLNIKFLSSVKARDISTIQTMLAQEGKPDVNCVSNGTSAIFTAVKNADVKMMELLISAEADCNTPDSLGCTPLHLAVIKSGECLKIHRKGPDAVAAAYLTSKDLMATKEENLASISLLLKHINNIDIILPEIGTALIIAALYEDIGVMKLLIENGADCTVRDQGSHKTIQEMITDPETQQTLQTIIREYENQKPSTIHNKLYKF